MWGSNEPYIGVFCVATFHREAFLRGYFGKTCSTGGLERGRKHESVHRCEGGYF